MDLDRCHQHNCSHVDRVQLAAKNKKKKKIQNTITIKSNKLPVNLEKILHKFIYGVAIISFMLNTPGIEKA